MELKSFFLKAYSDSQDLVCNQLLFLQAIMCQLVLN